MFPGGLAEVVMLVEIDTPGEIGDLVDPSMAETGLVLRHDPNDGLVQNIDMTVCQ